MSDYITVIVDGKEFKFKPIPNIIEERKIRSEMANILTRGYEEILDLENLISEAYTRHLQHNEDQYGKEEFGQMYKRYLEIIKLRKNAKGEEKEKLDAEFLEMTNKIDNNKHFSRFIELNQEKSFLENYAIMRITCVSKPIGFEFGKDGQKDFELKILNELIEKKNQVIDIKN
ncbi:MAG: hypothetical protein A2V66_10785 [Ignavibacteria bacterium RBG_13_36_8]|nr:MAG: hypothetical protein A2V66_10785 [Ignavibacteria bacterium RBG_13_36_8]